jgi:hypothetical protein
MQSIRSRSEDPIIKSAKESARLNQNPSENKTEGKSTVGQNEFPIGSDDGKVNRITTNTEKAELNEILQQMTEIKIIGKTKSPARIPVEVPVHIETCTTPPTGESVRNLYASMAIIAKDYTVQPLKLFTPKPGQFFQP